MGRSLHNKHTSSTSENGPPGCVWGILHIIKYHHWHHVKKRLMYKRRSNNKQDVGVKNPGNGADASSVDNVQADSDATMVKSTAEGKMSQSIPTAKASVKSRIARIAGEMAKKRGRHNRSSSCPVRSQLKRTESMHHLEAPSNLDPISEMVLNEGSPTIVHQNNESPSATSKLEPLPTTSYEESISVNNNCGESGPTVTGDYTVHDQVNENQKDNTLSQEKLDNNRMRDMLEKKLIHVKELDADASLHHPKDILEALDIINVNKELMLRILQDPGSPLAQHFGNQQAASAKMGLTKSESFPVPGQSGRGSEPIQLSHKHEGIGSPAKEESKSKNGSQAKKLKGSTSLKYAGERAMPSIPLYAADGSVQNLKNQGENQVAIRRFKDLRQKIKHVIKESRKEREIIAMDAILHKIPRGQKLTKELEKEIVNHSKDPALNREGKDSPGNGCQSERSVSSIKKNQMHHMRRTSSLNASLDRYCQLYETSFNSEAKFHTSERLKLRTEGAGSSVRSVPKTLGRIFSLPEIRSYKYQSEESPAVDGNISIRSSFDEQNSLDFPQDSDNHLQLDQAASTSVESNETKDQAVLIGDDVENLTAGDSVSHEEQDISEPCLVSLPNFNVLQDITSPRKFSLSEGVELAKQEDESVIDTPRVVESGVDTETMIIPSKHLSYDPTHIEVDARDIAEFNYVRDVLELSGFTRSESLGTWYSDDQPVDPLLNEDVEGCLVQDPYCPGNEEGGKCDHFLLFDLINEVLMEIYGRSYSYCPLPLSSLCHIRPMPARQHVLKEVWALISCYMSLRPEDDQSLDYVVSRDLAKSDGWMNLQYDSECIGLELEDMIFDDLLDEVICV